MSLTFDIFAGRTDPLRTLEIQTYRWVLSLVLDQREQHDDGSPSDRAPIRLGLRSPELSRRPPPICPRTPGKSVRLVAPPHPPQLSKSQPLRMSAGCRAWRSVVHR